VGPAPPEPQRSGILKSNVDAVQHVEVPRKRPRSIGVAVVLVFALGVIAGAAAILSLSAPATPQPRSEPVGLPTQRPVATSAPVPATNSQAAASPGPLAPINGISCDALESTLVHIHVHLAIFVDGEEQLVPFGIGIGRPWSVTDTDQGPFVDDGSCFYWVHTHSANGVVHIESPVRRTFSLGDFFAIWGQPLSTTQVGPAQGQVITYVNGMRSDINPPDIRLTSHQRIQLDVGEDVPPYPFDFPPGD
jgi:hypothetical protein